MDFVDPLLFMFRIIWLPYLNEMHIEYSLGHLIFKLYPLFFSYWINSCIYIEKIHIVLLKWRSKDSMKSLETAIEEPLLDIYNLLLLWVNYEGINHSEVIMIKTDFTETVKSLVSRNGDFDWVFVMCHNVYNFNLLLEGYSML